MHKDQLEEGVERLMHEVASGDAHGETAADLERWEALSFETAGEQEIQALHAEATDSAEVARRWEAYRPMDQRVKQRLLDRLQAEIQHGGEPQQDIPRTPQSGSQARLDDQVARVPDVDVDSPTQQLMPEQDGEDEDAEKIIPFAPPQPDRAPTRGHRWWWLTPAVAALAAALLAVVLWSRSPVTLPIYEATAQAGSQKMRSQAAALGGALSLSQGDTFEIVLRPAIAVEQRLEVGAFAQRPEGLERVDLRSEISETGSIRLSGRFDAPLRSNGDDVDLWLVVSEYGNLPSPADLLRDSQQGAPKLEYRLLRYQLQQLDPTDEP